MSAKNDCFTCSQSRKKQKSSVICTGCQKPFCKEHHQEHRKSIEKEFEGLIQQHNILRQTLYNEKTDNNSNTSKLLKMIDNWEKEMIVNIKAAAATNKARLTQIMNEEKDQLKKRFKSMGDELQSNQSSSDYVELDIHDWQRQINECKQKLEQLQTANNDFININIKPLDWNNTISIQQRKDVFIKTNTAAPVRSILTRRRPSSQCRQCEKFYEESTGYNSRFCSAGCEVKYDERNPDESSSDDNRGADDDHCDACFHGNCIVLLANGSTKHVKDIRKGDVLKTAVGLEATVTYAIEILRNTKKAPMVSFDNGLIITPWHPVRIDGQWVFPHDVGHQINIECQAVYNFALDVGHSVIINGIECVTLGHNFKGEVIGHPYFGTNKVLEDLHAMDVNNDGFIKVSPNSIVRNNETGLISGICRQTLTSNANHISYNQHV